MDGKDAGKKKSKKEKKVDLDNLKRELEMVSLHYVHVRHSTHSYSSLLYDKITLPSTRFFRLRMYGLFIGAEVRRAENWRQRLRAG